MSEKEIAENKAARSSGFGSGTHRVLNLSFLDFTSPHLLPVGYAFHFLLFFLCVSAEIMS